MKFANLNLSQKNLDENVVGYNRIWSHPQNVHQHFDINDNLIKQIIENYDSSIENDLMCYRTAPQLISGFRGSKGNKILVVTQCEQDFSNLLMYDLE